MDETVTYADMHVGFIHKAFTTDGVDIVRGVLKHKTTGELFEMVGVDKGNDEIVPLFLVPMGGAQTMVKEYEVMQPNDNVNQLPAPKGAALH